MDHWKCCPLRAGDMSFPTNIWGFVLLINSSSFIVWGFVFLQHIYNPYKVSHTFMVELHLVLPLIKFSCFVLMCFDSNLFPVIFSVTGKENEQAWGKRQGLKGWRTSIWKDFITFSRGRNFFLHCLLISEIFSNLS